MVPVRSDLKNHLNLHFQRKKSEKGIIFNPLFSYENVKENNVYALLLLKLSVEELYN